MNILVIDDNENTSGAIADYCSMNDISCKEINDGKLGLFEIQKHEYELIILDIAMPDYTGLDILSQLKKQGVNNRNIIILTARQLKLEDFEPYKELGRIIILNKPISLAQLDETIKNSVIQIGPVEELTTDLIDINHN